MTAADLDAFVASVLGDEELHGRLIAVPGRPDAIAALVVAALDAGLDVTEADVAEAAVAARRRWLETWV